MENVDHYQSLFWAKHVLFGRFWFVYRSELFTKRLALNCISTIVFVFFRVVGKCLRDRQRKYKKGALFMVMDICQLRPTGGRINLKV